MDMTLPTDACTFVARAKEAMTKFVESKNASLDSYYIQEIIFCLDSAIEKLTSK